MEFFQPFSNKGLGRPARHCNGKVLETRLKFSYTGLGGVWVTVWGFKSRGQSRALTCLFPRPHYSARPIRFGSRGLSEEVSFPQVRLGYVTEVNWPKGLGKRRTGTREGTDHRKLSSITWNVNSLLDRTFKLWASKQILTNLFSVFPGVSSVPLTPLFSLNNKSFMNNINNFFKIFVVLGYCGLFCRFITYYAREKPKPKNNHFCWYSKDKGKFLRIRLFQTYFFLRPLALSRPPFHLYDEKCIKWYYWSK